MDQLENTCPRCEHSFGLDAEAGVYDQVCPSCSYVETYSETFVASTFGMGAAVMRSRMTDEIRSEEDFHPRDLMKIDPMVKKRLADLQRGALLVGGILVSLWFFEEKVREPGRAEVSPVEFNVPVADLTRSKDKKYSEAKAPQGESVAHLVRSLKPISENEREALTVVEQILSARSASQLFGLIRDSADYKQRFEEFYERQPYRPDPVIGLRRSSLLSSTKFIFHYEVILGGNVTKSLSIGKTTGGTYRFDWACYVSLSSMPWQDFLDEKPEELQVFRAWVSISEDKLNPVLSLKHPYDTQAPMMTVPLEPNAAAAKAVLFQFKTSTEEELPMSLGLRFDVERAGARKKLVLDSLLATGWIISGAK